MNCICCNKPIDKHKKFCNNKCQKEYEYITYIERWKKGNETGLRGEYQISMHIKTYLFVNIKANVQDVAGGRKMYIPILFL